MKKILGISGSLRKESYNTGLLRAIKSLLPEDFEMEILSLKNIPLYNADLERKGFPKQVIDLKEKIREADCLIIASPEYNFSVTGVLKNALDWVSRPYDETMPTIGKKTYIVGATTGRFGTVLSQRHLKRVLHVLKAKVVNSKKIHISSAESKFDKSGDLIDENTKEELRELARRMK